LELSVQEHTEELKGTNSELEEEIIVRKETEVAPRIANEELTCFNSVMIGRELRMIELKKEVNELCERLSRPPCYSLDFEKEES
jgi:phosphoglycerate-specific signal transduction histidine kinase